MKNEIAEHLAENAPSSIPPQLIAQVTQEVTQYQGPIPPPALLREYNEILPDAAERILSMAEQQMAHRIDLEQTVVHGGARRAWLGLILGFAAAVLVTVSGTWVAVTVHAGFGAAIITGTVVTLAAVFVYGRRSQQAEREHKAELMAGKRRPK